MLLAAGGTVHSERLEEVRGTELDELCSPTVTGTCFHKGCYSKLPHRKITGWHIAYCELHTVQEVEQNTEAQNGCALENMFLSNVWPFILLKT